MRKLASLATVLLFTFVATSGVASADIPEDCILGPAGEVQDWAEPYLEFVIEGEPLAVEGGPVPDINGCTTDISDPSDPEILCQPFETVHTEHAYVHGYSCVYKDGEVGYTCTWTNTRGSDGKWTTTSEPPGC